MSLEFCLDCLWAQLTRAVDSYAEHEWVGKRGLREQRIGCKQRLPAEEVHLIVSSQDLSDVESGRDEVKVGLEGAEGGSQVASGEFVGGCEGVDCEGWQEQLSEECKGCVVSQLLQASLDSRLFDASIWSCITTLKKNDDYDKKELLQQGTAAITKSNFL